MEPDSIALKRLARKQLITFLLLTAAFSSLGYPRLIRVGIYHASSLLTLAVAWSPAAAALITRLVYQKNLRGIGWGWGKTRYQVWSYFIPIFYCLIAYLIIWVSGLGKFPNWGFVHELAVRFGAPNGSPTRLIAQYVWVAGVVDLFGGSIGALGEEIGWRGLLVPELAKISSFTTTALVSSFIWAIWHYPLIFLDGYNGGTPRWYSALCFTFLVLGVGTVSAWMRLKSGSVWTAMFLHASSNLYLYGIFEPLTQSTALTKYFAGEFGALLAVIGPLLGIYFWRKRSGLPDSCIDDDCRARRTSA
jgi:uncharacterized protein